MFDIFEYLDITRILQNDPLKQSRESGFLIKLYYQLSLCTNNEIPQSPWTCTQILTGQYNNTP